MGFFRLTTPAGEHVLGLDGVAVALPYVRPGGAGRRGAAALPDGVHGRDRGLPAGAAAEAGQRIVAESGFIPLTLHAQQTKPTESAPAKDAKAAQAAMRVSINFRFKRGSSLLDAKGFQDVDSLVKRTGMTTCEFPPT